MSAAKFNGSRSHVSNVQVKPGFIFVPLYPDDDHKHTVPESHLPSHYGGWGYFGKLETGTANGWVPVTFDQYQKG